MATTAIKSTASTRSGRLASIWTVLRFTYGIVPVVAGLDKFTNILTDWSQYLSPSVADLLPFPAAIFMVVVGIIEILAGILVFVKTELGAYIVAAWLTLIALTLLLSFNYLDVAVRDLVMAVGAFTLARLTPLTRDSSIR